MQRRWQKAADADAIGIILVPNHARPFTMNSPGLLTAFTRLTLLQAGLRLGVCSALHTIQR
jgi:hypothetical protein